MSKYDNYHKNRHAVYLLQYHLVVVTKYRHPVLTGKLCDRLITISHEIIEGYWKGEILEINTDTDYIHILFEASPQTQLSKLINNYKTVTSRLIRKEFPEELRPYYWKPYFYIRHILCQFCIKYISKDDQPLHSVTREESRLTPPKSKIIDRECVGNYSTIFSASSRTDANLSSAISIGCGVARSTPATFNSSKGYALLPILRNFR